MQNILQIISLVCCCPNKFSQLSLSDENPEILTLSPINHTMECTTEDLNEKSVDETEKFKIKIKKLDELMETQKIIYNYLFVKLLRYDFRILYGVFPNCKKTNTDENSKENVKMLTEEFFKRAYKLYPGEAWINKLLKSTDEEFENFSAEERFQIIDDIIALQMKHGVNNEPADICQESSYCRFLTNILVDICDVLNNLWYYVRIYKEGEIPKEHLEIIFQKTKEELLKLLNEKLPKRRIGMVVEKIAELFCEFKGKQFIQRRDSLIAKFNEFIYVLQQILMELEE